MILKSEVTSGKMSRLYQIKNKIFYFLNQFAFSKIMK